MKKLTKIQQKRIEILKDVLKHIKANRIVAEQEKLMMFEDFNNECDVSETNIQKVLKTMSKKKKVCTVCLRGSILFSSIWKNNKFYTKMDKYSWSSDLNIGGGIASHTTKENTYLEKLFSKEQLMMMERAFESDFNENELPDEIIELCDDFYSNYDNDHDRLIAIVKNSISNNGTFIP